MSFEGSSPWSLVIHCGQSVSINRGLNIQVHNLQCSQLLLRFQFILEGWKEHDNNVECLFDMMLIIRLVHIKQEESTAMVRWSQRQQLIIRPMNACLSLVLKVMILLRFYLCRELS
jgi:hypothetical protein